MNKNKKALLALSTGALLASLFLSSCSKSGQSSSDTPINDKVEIWSTYDSVKVAQNSDAAIYYDKLDGKVSISMMKNEVESGQFIITPGKDVSNYIVTKTDLKRIGSNDIIPQEDIQIFVQKYIEINNKFDLGNTSFYSGDLVPDMLLPIEKSVEYKENKIKAGNNQGITIDVKTTKETKPGKYHGTFSVAVDDKTYNVPVDVEVWDITKDGKNLVQSSFLIYKNYLLQGEYNTTDEMIYAYYDYLLDYNMNSYIITDKDFEDDYMLDYIANIKQRIDRESLNSIVIPIYFQSTYTFESTVAGDIRSRDMAYKYIKNLALNSSEDYDMISLAYFYTTAFDEANLYPELYPHALDFYKKGGELEKTLKYYQDRLTSDGVFTKLLAEGNSSTWVNKVKDFILNIPSVWPTTVFEDAQVDDMIVTNCPTFNQFDDGIYQQKLVDGRHKSNENLWVYTCSGPRNPYPTFHLDDYNLGTRVGGWMMKKYHINGYLYWAVNLYEPVSVFGSVDNFVDPYITPDRAGQCPGDGFLLYPGKYYNHFGPYGSLRLNSYRDSMDDYELLTIYEELLNERAIKYGTEFDVNQYVDDLYDSLFCGAVYHKDDSLLPKARNELARRIASLQNEDELVFDSYSDGINNNSTIYATCPGLTINNEYKMGEKAGSGYVYHVSTPVNEVKELVIKTNYQYNYTFSNSGILFKNGDKFTPTRDSSLTINDDNSLDVSIKSVYMDDDEEIGGKTQRFMPGIAFKKKDLSDLKNIQFNVTNTSDKEIEVYVYLSNDVADNEVTSVTLKPGQTRYVNINLLRLTDNFLSSVNEWSFKMRNVTTNEDNNMVLYPERTFKVSPVVYLKKGE